MVQSSTLHLSTVVRVQRRRGRRLFFCDRLRSGPEFGSTRPYAGELAKQHEPLYINGTVTELKRLIMLPFHSQECKALSADCPYEIVEIENGMAGIQVEMNAENFVFRSEQIIAYLLNELMVTVRKRQRVKQIVMTVNPCWSSVLRRALVNACSIAGLECVGLVNSLTAAATSYVTIHRKKLPEAKQKPVAVVFIDFGDSETAAGVAFVRQMTVEMKSLVSLQELSGSGMTKMFAAYLASKIESRFKVRPSVDDRTLLRFLSAVEKAKKQLSINAAVSFEVQSIEGVDVSFQVNRDEFEYIIREVIEKIPPLIDRALSAAGIGTRDVFEIQMLGGGSRIPAIQYEVTSYFQRQPLKSLDSDECNVIGAGYIAARLSPRMRTSVLVKDILHDNITAKIGKDSIEIAPIGCFLPCSRSVKVTLNGSALLEIFEGMECIGTIDISGGEQTVLGTLEFRIEQNGILEYLCGRFEVDGKPIDLAVNVTFKGDMNASQIEEYKGIQERLKELAELEQERTDARNELESVLLKYESITIDELSRYMSSQEATRLFKSLNDARLWFEQVEFDPIEPNDYRIKAHVLKEGFEKFARRKR